MYGHFLGGKVAPRRMTRHVSMPVGFIGTYVQWVEVYKSSEVRFGGLVPRLAIGSVGEAERFCLGVLRFGVRCRQMRSGFVFLSFRSSRFVFRRLQSSN